MGHQRERQLIAGKRRILKKDTTELEERGPGKKEEPINFKGKTSMKKVSLVHLPWTKR